jgi:hypothetical protein
MATNGANGNKRPSKRSKAPSIKRRPVQRPTAAQLRAMGEFVRKSGHKFSREEIEETAAQWRD